jgi:hypothetical protein
MRTLVLVPISLFLSFATFALAGCTVPTDAAPSETPEPATISTEDLGQSCASDDECASGSCADGVCCATACDGECEACNLPGQVGSCSPHASGSDPDGECATPGCYEGTQESFACNGARTCDVTIVSCGAYACGESACLSDCRSDADCAADATCQGASCRSVVQE